MPLWSITITDNAIKDNDTSTVLCESTKNNLVIVSTLIYLYSFQALPTAEELHVPLHSLPSLRPLRSPKTSTAPGSRHGQPSAAVTVPDQRHGEQDDAIYTHDHVQVGEMGAGEVRKNEQMLFRSYEYCRYYVQYIHVLSVIIRRVKKYYTVCTVAYLIVHQ